ncbi:MAG: hypothetical protein HUU28_11095 [Planctomycetaceae bacterium]|nr:hypothetical protein [Planctomycetaceae bacterium]
MFALLPALWGAYAELSRYIDGHEWWTLRLEQSDNSRSGWGPLERGIELFQWTIPATAKRDGVDVAPDERIEQLILHFFAVGPEHPPVFSRRADQVVHVWLDQEAVTCLVEALARGLFPRSSDAPRDPIIHDLLAEGYRSGTAEDVPVTVTVTSRAGTRAEAAVCVANPDDLAARWSNVARVAAWSLIAPNRDFFVAERMAESVSVAFHSETLLPLLALLDEIQGHLLSRTTPRPNDASVEEPDLSFRFNCEQLLDLPISLGEASPMELKWFRELRLHFARGSLGDVGAESWIEEPEILDVRLDVVGLSLLACEVALAGFDDRPVPSFFDTKCASRDESETTQDGERMLTRDLMFWPCGPAASQRIFTLKQA